MQLILAILELIITVILIPFQLTFIAVKGLPPIIRGYSKVGYYKIINKLKS